jgi:urease accessory protein
VSANAALQHLLTWLSPAFPVGGFAWSAGLETAIVDGRVTTRAALADWLGGTLAHGSLWTDAVFVSQAWQHAGERKELQDLADLCVALTAASERITETLTTGDAFVAAAQAWPSPAYDLLPSPCPYPIAVGAVAAAHGVDRASTVLAYLTTAVHSQISVAVRLVPLGQTDGLACLAGLEPAIAAQAARASTAGLDDLGTIAYAADIAQMRHEQLPTRIFRS